MDVRFCCLWFADRCLGLFVDLGCLVCCSWFGSCLWFVCCGAGCGFGLGSYSGLWVMSCLLIVLVSVVSLVFGLIC